MGKIRSLNVGEHDYPWDNMSGLVRFLLSKTEREFREVRAELRPVFSREDLETVVRVQNGASYDRDRPVGAQIAHNVELAMEDLDCSPELPDLCRTHGDALRFVCDLYWWGDHRNLDWIDE